MAAITAELPSDIRIQTIILPHISQGVIPRLRNVWFVRSVDADIIHVNGDVQYSILGAPRSKALLTILDLGSVVRLTGLRKAALRLFWYTLPTIWSKEITVISEQIRRELVALEPHAADKVQVVHIAIDSRFFRPKANQPSKYQSFLHVGTTENKNLDRVLEAFAGGELGLHVVGSITDEQRTNADVLNVSMHNYVSLSDEELLDLYHSTDALIFVSTYEGFGMPIVEAQAVGIPVITSSIAPLTEIAGNAALFVDPYSVDEIRRACHRLASDVELGRDLVQQGYRNSEQFRPSVVAQNYARCYRRFVG